MVIFMDETYFKNRIPVIRRFDLPIFVNQLGYKPASIKRAVITKECSRFYIIDNDDKICFEGNVTHFGTDKDSQDDVYIADFSDFNETGQYQLKTEGGEKSLIFNISENIYDNVLFETMKAFYYLRCGEELKEAYAGEFIHAACHTDKAVLHEDKNISLDITGGWHDAGDYGRYVTAGACALAHLLYAYKMYPDKLASLKLNIPESSSSIPDILEECSHELEWILKMQRADGGVYHKATTYIHAQFVMPEDDKDTMIVFPVSSMATADLAAICAMASTIYKDFDADFSQILLNAATKSAKWLDENPDFVGFANPDGCNTGEYGEDDDKENRFWAYAELYAATKDEYYHEKLKASMKICDSFVGLGYADVGGLGALSYLLCNNENCLDEIKNKFKESFINEALRLKNLADNCGYGVAMSTEHYTWGSNMNLLKHGMIFAIADYLENDTRFLPYATLQADYLLGVNATGFSYVTGSGEFCCEQPHLRPAYADGIERCIPGMVSGGPNRTPQDIDASILIKEGTPPMKCFVDDVGCYSLNEITIYWNSPAVFLLAYLK